MAQKNLEVKCPHCSKKFDYYTSEFRPFCCERCKMIDMGHWWNESYTVPVKGNLDSEMIVDEFEIDESDQGLGNFYDEE